MGPRLQWDKRISGEDQVAGWPSIDRADDQRLAQALPAGDTTAMAQIYDAYAPRLFDYCHVLLRDEDAAAQAVHDSLITARERIGGLPDPRLFRGWLYAITRAECQRRRASAEIPAERQKAAEADGLGETDESTRRLVHAALLVLDGQRREVLDLSFRHELGPHELAEVLSVTPQEASVLTEQARNDLDDAFATVFVATTGRDDCPSVTTLAGPPGTPLDSDTCGALARHIGNCPICGLRANRKVATTRLLHAMPIAAVPADLRARFLATGTSPEYADLRATIAMRSDPAPAPMARTEPEPRRASRMWFAVWGAGFGALLVFGGVFVMLPGADAGRPADGQAIAAAPGGSSSADPSEPVDASPSPKKSRTPTPKASKTSTTPRPKRSSPSPAGRKPNPAPPPPAPGTLTVSGCHMDGTHSCQMTVRAAGGPVTWRITGASDPLEAGGAGSLSAGESQGVTVKRAGWCLGTGSGSVSFSSGATARITWLC